MQIAEIISRCLRPWGYAIHRLLLIFAAEEAWRMLLYLLELVGVLAQWRNQRGAGGVSSPQILVSSRSIRPIYR